MTQLVKLFDKYQCDKGTVKHRYDRVYEPILEPIQMNPIRILEIGVFKGNSTKAFIEFCPNLKIIGIDIFTRVNMKDIPILNHNRVHLIKCDSLIGPNKEFVKVVGNNKFDIIIDDGLHTHKAQRKTFKNFISYLKENGIYFIEDVWAYDRMTDKEKKHSWLKKHRPSFSEEEYQKLLNVLAQYNITYHDLRKGHEPDTFILEIRK